MIDTQKIPHLMKYMGSKREILDFIMGSIKLLDINSEWFCDLFAGTSVVGCSLKDEYNLQINDIQSYSSIFANTYLRNLKETVAPLCINDIKAKVEFLVEEFCEKYPELQFDYSVSKDFSKIGKLEKEQQKIIEREFDTGFNLFTKYYSGTYWSFNQCLWIDSIRAVAEEYRGRTEFYVIMSSLIFAMSYTSQGTGHFAQFRDMNESNMNDILIYRHKEVWSYFERKFLELVDVLDIAPTHEYRVSTLDYLDCLRVLEPNTIVYADPPYSAVHYSRFYHAIETVVKYDYPSVRYKGRYREDRHPSPFGKRTEVNDAFRVLFENVKARDSHLILSYSDNGMISQKEILRIGNEIFGHDYENAVWTRSHVHSKMGRSDEHNMDVNELIISYKRMG